MLLRRQIEKLTPKEEELHKELLRIRELRHSGHWQTTVPKERDVYSYFLNWLYDCEYTYVLESHLLEEYIRLDIEQKRDWDKNLLSFIESRRNEIRSLRCPLFPKEEFIRRLEERYEHRKMRDRVGMAFCIIFSRFWYKRSENSKLAFRQIPKLWGFNFLNRDYGAII